MPRRGGRRSSSSLSSDSMEDLFNVRMHRRPLDQHQRRHSVAGARRRDRDGDVFIDINNAQGLSPPPGDRSRSRMRSRPRADSSDIEEEIDRLQRKIRENKRRQDEHEAEARHHWEFNDRRRTRSHSPENRAEMRALLEQLRREQVERQLRDQQRRSRSRRDSSSDDEDDDRRARRTRSRVREHAFEDFERDNEIRRLKRREHDDRANHRVEDAILVERMRALERQNAEREHEELIRQKIEYEQKKQEAEEAERKKEEKELKKKAVKDHLREEAEKKVAKQKEQEKLEKEIEERMKPMLVAQGYNEQEIKDILSGEVVAAAPTLKYVKVSSDEISPESLNSYGISWEWEKHAGSGWIIIHQELSTSMYDRLEDHTRRLRQKLLAPAPRDSDVVEVKVNDRDRDKMYLVRKKSKGPMGRLFTFM